MKKLSEEEYKALTLGGSGRSTQLYDQLINLKPGEALIVTKAYWGTRKHAPTRVARYIAKKYKWQFKSNRLVDQTGWAIHRLK